MTMVARRIGGIGGSAEGRFGELRSTVAREVEADRRGAALDLDMLGEVDRGIFGCSTCVRSAMIGPMRRQRTLVPGFGRCRSRDTGAGRVVDVALRS